MPFSPLYPHPEPEEAWGTSCWSPEPILFPQQVFGASQTHLHPVHRWVSHLHAFHLLTCKVGSPTSLCFCCLCLSAVD